MVFVDGRQSIWLIYSETEKPYAQQLTAFFSEHGQQLPEDQEKGLIRFLVSGSIAADSAVVLLSDAATADPAWQQAVRSIPAGFRIIPVGGTVQIDYSDETILPRRIQEINYIHLDEAFLEHVQESLSTPPEFYDLKNEVTLMMNQWKASGNADSFLMSSYRKAKQFHKAFQNACAMEKSPAILEGYREIMDYLKRSMRHAAQSAFMDALQSVRNILVALAGIALVVLFLTIRSYLKRAQYAQILLSVDTASEDFVTTAVRLTEGISNPFVPKTSQGRYYGYLSELLEKNWPNSPLGLGQYKWALNDAAVSQDPRYLLTANGKGQAVLWDAWTGEIVRRDPVSSSPLAALDLSTDGRGIALDSQGAVFLSTDGRKWTPAGVTCPIEWTDAVRLELSDDGNHLLIHDATQLFCYTLKDGRVSEQFRNSFDRIACCGISTDGNFLCIASKDSTWAAWKADAEGNLSRYALSASPNAQCQADFTAGRAVYADPDGRIWLWDSRQPETVTNTGLLLSQPICLTLSDDSWLVYHDRNAGTQLYDLKRNAVLCDCLPYAYAVRRLDLEGTLLMGYSSSMIYSEDVAPVLPLRDIPSPVLTSFRDSSDAHSGHVVRSIAIDHEAILRILLSIGNEETAVVMDPASRYFIGPAQQDSTLMDQFPEDYGYYSGVNVHFTGRPTVVGILPDVETIVIGAYDGSFYEVTFTESGSAFVSSHTKTPAHSPITAIHRTSSCYVLEDAQGNLWYKRLGYPLVLSNTQWVHEVKEKMHMCVSDELLNLISPETARALELHRFSIPEGKEWE